MESVLKDLQPEERELILLMYKLWKPEDWKGRWPPKSSQIGDYIGRKFRGKPLSESAVRYRKKIVIEALRTRSVNALYE